MHGRLFLCYLNDSERQNEVPVRTNRLILAGDRVRSDITIIARRISSSVLFVCFFFFFNSKPFLAEAVEEEAFDF